MLSNKMYTKTNIFYCCEENKKNVFSAFIFYLKHFWIYFCEEENIVKIKIDLIVVVPSKNKRIESLHCLLFDFV